MTLSEAHALLSLSEILDELRTSLRVEQIAAFTNTLDMTQKILLMEVLGTILPSGDEAAYSRRRGWVQLVESAKERVAVSEDPLRPMVST